MRKRSFLFGALAALAMAGCSDNDLTQENGPQIADKDGKMYMKVEIANSNGNGSRAVEYVDGTGTENEINEILFVFYNENKNYIGKSRLKKKADGDTTPGEGYDGFLGNLTNGTTPIEKVMVTIVPVDVNAGTYVPKYVVAYVNPTTSWSNNVETPLKDFKNIQRGSYLSDGVNAGKFLMNNVVYYASNTAKSPTVLAEITGTLYETEDEAGKENAATSVTINVERVAAKVEVSANANFEKETGADDDGYVNTHTNTYSVKFVPEKWALNATATNTYLVKQFLKTDDATEMAYTDMPTFASNDASWNDITHERSYWCTSLYHHHGSYPSISSEANNPGISLKYYTWNEVVGTEGKPGVGKDLKSTDATFDYCMEHTVNANTYSDIGEGALTSVIVVGKYQLKKDGTVQQAGTTFYTYGKTDDGKANVYVGNDILVAMAAGQNVIYVNVAADGEKADYQPIQKKKNLEPADYANIFKVFHPTDVKTPGRYRFLGLVDNCPTDGEYYYQKEDGTYELLTTQNWNEVKETLTDLLKNTTVAAEMYTNGMAYFNIPIQHFGGNPTGYGSFGVVRNHYYKVNIKGIEGLGTAISGENNPIVPPRETLTYYVRTQLNVLSWRVMDQGDVTLK